MGIQSVLPGAEVKWAAIGITTSGETEIVALVAGKKLRIINVVFTVSSAVTISFRSNGVDVIDPMWFDVYGGLHWMRGPSEGEAFMETVAGEAFRMWLSGASNVSGSVCYQEI
jgi:hypothetical protein